LLSEVPIENSSIARLALIRVAAPVLLEGEAEHRQG